MSFHIYLTLLFLEASSFFRLWQSIYMLKLKSLKNTVKLENTLSPFCNVIGAISDPFGSDSPLFICLT